MSLTTFLAENISRKITLVEIDLAESQSFFLNHEPGIWKFNVVNLSENVTCNFQNGAFCYGCFENECTVDAGLNGVDKTVSSLAVNKEQYTRVSTIANLRTQNKGFLFDSITKIIYIHFDNFDPPELFNTIEFGIPEGYSTQGIYLNNTYYEGRILSLPNLAKRKDPLAFGIIRFPSGRITLENKDGLFDRIGDRNIFGQPARIKIGGDDLAYADYGEIFTGYVEDFTITPDEFITKATDSRKQFSRNLPINVFDTTTYPDIETRNADKPIPLAWGEITNAPVICTNEDEAPVPANYEFKICDTTYHSIKEITTVYVEGTAETPSSTSLANATFELAAADYTPGENVTVDFKGYDDSAGKDGSGTLIENALIVLTDIIEDYLDTTYNADNYDTTEWAAAQADAPNIGLWVKEKKTIDKIIQDISKACFGNFLVKSDGKYTFRTYDSDADAEIEIKRDEQIALPRCQYNSQEYISSVIIKFDQDQDENEYREYPDNTGEDDAFDIYATRRERTIETIISNSTDATTLATSMLNYYQTIPPIFEVRTKIKPAELEIMDNAALAIKRPYEDWFGLVKCEIIGLEYDLVNFETIITGRYIENLDEAALAVAGYWTSDSPTFPAWLGSGSAGTWDASWTTEQKIYAKTHYGYWANNNGYIDATDEDSLNASTWSGD